jgi:hypothetical protein
LGVFSLDENVITPWHKNISRGHPGQVEDKKNHTRDADEQVRKVVQQTLTEIGRVCETMYVYLRFATNKSMRSTPTYITADTPHLVVFGNFSLEYPLGIFVRLSRVHGNGFS